MDALSFFDMYSIALYSGSPFFAYLFRLFDQASVGLLCHCFLLCIIIDLHDLSLRCCFWLNVDEGFGFSL
jgi:hypothetical protein